MSFIKGFLRKKKALFVSTQLSCCNHKEVFMDFSSILNTIMGSDSVSSLSNLTGTSEKDVSGVLSSVLPLFMNGAQGQATNAETAQSFANALASHGKDDFSDLSSFLGNVDMDDGAKIVEHLLGKDGAATAANNISAQSGVSAGNISSILSATAPLLMSMMGKQATAEADAAPDDVDLNSLVGSLFGGGSGNLFSCNDGKDAAGGLGDLLSGLFKK